MMTPRSLRVSVFALLVLCSQFVASSSAVAAEDATPYASPIASPTAVQQWPSWVALGPNDVIIARAVRTETCPQITIDGSTGTMNIRALPNAEHPNVVCETAVPSGSKSVSIDGQSMPLPVAEPQRIASSVIPAAASKGPIIQACNDPAQWPFATRPPPPPGGIPTSSSMSATISIENLPVPRTTRAARAVPMAHLGHLECRLLPTGRAASRRRALDSGSRQP